jgi:hypothetical protein
MRPHPKVGHGHSLRLAGLPDSAAISEKDFLPEPGRAAHRRQDRLHANDLPNASFDDELWLINVPPCGGPRLRGDLCLRPGTNKGFVSSTMRDDVGLGAAGRGPVL